MLCPTNQRPVFCLPYDPRLPRVAAILRRRHRALLARDIDAREYLPEPPIVTYTRTKNIRPVKRYSFSHSFLLKYIAE